MTRLTPKSPRNKQTTWKIHLPLELQLFSSFEYRPDRAVLLRQPSLVVLLAHLRRRWRNSTSHHPSFPTVSPSPLASADTALRGEWTSNRRCLDHRSRRTAFPHVALLPPTSFPLDHTTPPFQPVCSVDCSVSASRSFRFFSTAAAISRSTSSAFTPPQLSHA